MILKVRNYNLIFSGWTVRIYHNLQSDDKESWETFNRHLEIGSHVDICKRHPSAGKSTFGKESKCGDLALGKILSLL
jgi:hypothetical protein